MLTLPLRPAPLPFLRPIFAPQPVKINAAPKIPTAASAANHKAGGGNVEITNKRVVYNAGPKIPTAASAASHVAGGGQVKITNAPVKFNAGPKIPTAASAAQHKAGGGNVEITNKVGGQTTCVERKAGSGAESALVGLRAPAAPGCSEG